MTAPSPPLISRHHVGILGLQPRDKAAMLAVSTIELFSRRILMKIEVTSLKLVSWLISSLAMKTTKQANILKGNSSLARNITLTKLF